MKVFQRGIALPRQIVKARSGSFCNARRRRNPIHYGHPFMIKNDDRLKIQAILRHLGCGRELRDFPGTESEKLALIRTASSRRLVAWHKGRTRYEVTPVGWTELTPRRRFGLGSLMVSTAVGATVGAAILGFFWVSADASHGFGGPSRVARAEKTIVAPVSPAAAEVNAAARPSAPASQTASASPAAPAVAQPAPAALAGSPTEPAKVAEQPVLPEPSAEAAPIEIKQAAVKKPRRKTVARRRTDETGATWAYADSWRTRQSNYSGYGGQPSYGGQGFGFFR
jgi:hypothetical protein